MRETGFRETNDSSFLTIFCNYKVHPPPINSDHSSLDTQSIMNSQTGPNVTTRAAAVANRINMINGWFEMDDGHTEEEARNQAIEKNKARMNAVREAVSDAAHKVADAVEEGKHDMGRLIAAIDTLQQAKNIACDAIILPHGKGQ